MNIEELRAKSFEELTNLKGLVEQALKEKEKDRIKEAEEAVRKLGLDPYKIFGATEGKRKSPVSKYRPIVKSDDPKTSYKWRGPRPQWVADQLAKTGETKESFAIR